MAGKKERHHFIAQLRVAHWLAFRIARAKQRIQQVTARLIGRTPVPNDAPDDLVQFGDGAPFPRRKEIRNRETKQKGLARIHDEFSCNNFHGFPDSFGGAGNLRAIQTLPDNFERHAHHVFMKIPHTVVFPRIEHAARRAGHHRRVSQNVLPAERRLDETSLPPPELSFAGQ